MRVLRSDMPPSGWEEDYARDGFYVIKDALTDQARDAIVREIIDEPRTVDLLARYRGASGSDDDATQMTLRPWDTMCDHPGETAQDGLLDAPLVKVMLRHAMSGSRYTFCHSGFSVRCPGNLGTPMHQDFAYGPKPYSSPEHSPDSKLAVVQILYYPGGFKMGDNHLRVMPGSHKISAFSPELEGPGLQRGGDHETTLKEVFGLSPLATTWQHGIPKWYVAESFHYLSRPSYIAGWFGRFAHHMNWHDWLVAPRGDNEGRCFHGVWPKPRNSPEETRLFVFYVYKNGGMHRHTQPVPHEWLPPPTDDSEWAQHRRMLLDRETNWEEQTVSRTWEDTWNPAYVALGPPGAGAIGSEAKL